ncbi:putative serine/threonine-protein kinase At1g01540 isoform X2 [Wolffia australiana]
MSFMGNNFLSRELSRPTSILGLKLWVVVGVCMGSIIVLFLVLTVVCLACKCRRRRRRRRRASPLKRRHRRDATPAVSKEIAEVWPPSPPPPPPPEVVIEVGAKNEERRAKAAASSVDDGGGRGPPEVSHLGWGRWYTLRELEEATDGLAEENVIGEGGYGVVYRGVLSDGTVVAVKNLLNNRGQAEKDFKLEVEVIGRVRHKNLVRLLGYCIEGAYRILVYEYVGQGNLEQWLHGNLGREEPLSWETRMKIILGTAKGLAYLHEGLEPKVVHRDVKASNILIDTLWNPKVSDFGLAKLLNSERSYVTTRVMGTFGYVAPEYASTGMLNERSDVYSFGVLIMEIVSGRTPVDYTRPPGEVNLVEWLKDMVTERKVEEVVDPRMVVAPPAKVLKRVLLVALRCVDPDSVKRPKMSHVTHMLEMDDLRSIHARQR